MLKIQISELAAIMASLNSTWALRKNFDLKLAKHHATRRFMRHYGMGKKEMPRHAMAVGSKPALKYAARIAAGKIPADQILRNPVFAKMA